MYNCKPYYIFYLDDSTQRVISFNRNKKSKQLLLILKMNNNNTNKKEKKIKIKENMRLAEFFFPPISDTISPQSPLNARRKPLINCKYFTSKINLVAKE